MFIKDCIVCDETLSFVKVPIGPFKCIYCGHVLKQHGFRTDVGVKKNEKENSRISSSI